MTHQKLSRRTATAYGVREVHDVSLKVYWIAAAGVSCDDGEVQRALQASEALLSERLSPDYNGVGILLVHSGMDGLYCVFGLWRDDNVLHLRSFRGNKRSGRLDEFMSPGGAVCVWELPVLNYEGSIWREIHVQGIGSLETYLSSFCSFTF